MNPRHGGWLIALTLLLATVASAFSLPPASWPWAHWALPSWALALFYFWSVAAPGRTGMFSAWCLGLLFDAIAGASHPFGIHGICFAFTVFAASQLRERLLLYNLLQRSLVLLAIAGVALATAALVRVVLLDLPLSWLMLAPAVATMIAYPFIEWTLRPLANRLVGHDVAGMHHQGW